MTEELFHCTLCNQQLPAHAFSPSKLKRKSKNCRKCLNTHSQINATTKENLPEDIVRCRLGKELISRKDCVPNHGHICLEHYREGESSRMRAWRRSKGAKPRVVRRIDGEGRECTRCEAYKPWSEFYERQKTKMTECRECWLTTCREGRLRRNYGISEAEYGRLLEAQEFTCALCDEKETKMSWKSNSVNKLTIDHDHSCVHHTPDKACKKCIRGLLCNGCNISLGHVENKPRWKLMVGDYLETRPLQ